MLPVIKMLITLIRSVILYFLVIFAIRIMGKRQIGQLQPTELVITILISEAASIPLQDNSLPLTSSIIPILVLISLEIIVSVISMKSVGLRNAFSGKSIRIIHEGVIDQEKMRSLRFTIDDLTEALRQKDVFDLSEVDTAIVETNGTLSVYKKWDKQPLCNDYKNSQKSSGIPEIIVADGHTIKENLSVLGITEKTIIKELEKKGLKIRNVFLMTADSGGSFLVVKKERAKKEGN